MNIKGYDFAVHIQRKNIKNIYLRLLSAQVLSVSCPFSTSEDVIEAFLRSKSDWIIKHRLLIDQSLKGFHDPIYYLGKKYDLVLKKGRANIEISANSITVWAKDEKRARAYFYRKAALKLDELINTFKDKYEKILKDYGYSGQIVVKYRLLKSRWGACICTDGIIEINELLIHYPTECLEAVFWHECVHLLRNGHRRDFYEVLLKQMPNYREIQKKMR